MILRNPILVLFCIAALGLAVRGIALLAMRQVKPGRVISWTGMIAMISVWIFAGLGPFVGRAFDQVFQEFGWDVPVATQLIIDFFMLPFRYGLLWYPAALALSLCVLTLPEFVFGRSQAE
jgi:hypothetical protein